MHAFKDKLGRDWSVVVDLNTVKRVRGLLSVNLLDVVGGDLLKQLATDPEMLANVVYAVCKPEADAKGVSDEQFGAGLVGDAIALATDALLEELADFFPQPRRGLIQNALKKLKSLDALAVDKAQEVLNSGRLEKTMMESIGKLSAGDTPES